MCVCVCVCVCVYVCVCVCVCVYYQTSCWVTGSGGTCQVEAEKTSLHKALTSPNCISD